MTSPAAIARDNAWHSRRRPLAERFWAKVQKTEGCWIWIGALDGPGYGLIGGGGGEPNLKKAHRVSWEMHSGQLIPAGMVVMHTCDNRRCVNPDHLRLGTVAENNADRQRKGRSARTDGEHSPRTKLSAVDALNIKRRARAGESPRALAKEFGLSRSTVAAIKLGRNWKDLPNE